MLSGAKPIEQGPNRMKKFLSKFTLVFKHPDWLKKLNCESKNFKTGVAKINAKIS